MRNSYGGLVLAVALASSVAHAQKIVILEIDGDATGKLRTQVENAVKKGQALELVPISAYKDSAARKKLKGGAAMTPVGVARVSKSMNLDAAVGGEVTATSFHVVIYDFQGGELWTKDLKAKNGLLSEEFAGKLARAITAAAEQGAQRRTQGEAAPPPDAPVDEGQGEAVITPPERKVVEPSRHTRGGEEVAPGPTEPPEERDTDLDLEGRKRKSAGAVKGIPLIRFALTGMTVWRSQCLRPGVSSCDEYALKAQKPEGVIIDFSASAPYPGGAGALELFPFARFDNRIAQGFGLLASFGYAVSQTRIIEETAQGSGPEKPVVSTDIGWAAQAAWRFHFAAGYGEPQAPGFVGVRAGLTARSFNIDPKAGTPLPSSVRVGGGAGFPALGFDASVPISRYFRIEAGGSLYVNPTPSAEQIVGYGNLKDPTGGVQSTGWGFDAGFAGELYGPLGWTARVGMMTFVDHYFGQGQKWTVCNDAQCGGVSEERFISLYWGLTAAY